MFVTMALSLIMAAPANSRIETAEASVAMAQQSVTQARK